VGQQLALVVVGFVLTGVVGALIGYYLQNRAWAHQHEAGRRDDERAQARATFEEVSRRLDQRLYQMQQVYWAARSKALGRADDTAITHARDRHREIVAEWNDNLNRTLALAEISFGNKLRTTLEHHVYEEFAAAERGLHDIVEIAIAAESDRAKIPAFAHRIPRLRDNVNQLNLAMLRQLQADAIGRSAPGSTPATTVSPDALVLEIGYSGSAVRSLQSALRRAGESVDIDEIFGPQTWRAVCSLQRARGLHVDGIVGPLTRAELPSAASPAQENDRTVRRTPPTGR
jgi:murein L,D-transpeptidase YcbB/YkuD